MCAYQKSLNRRPWTVPCIPFRILFVSSPVGCIAARIACFSFSGLDAALLPSGSATDDLATAVAKLQKKNLEHPFVFVELEKFLPMWAGSANAEESEGSDAENSLLRKIAGAMNREPKKAKKTLTFAQWLVAYERYTLAAVATKQLTLPAALAHKNVCLQVGMRAERTKGGFRLGVLYDSLVRKAWAEKTYNEIPGFKVEEAAKNLDMEVLRQAEAAVESQGQANKPQAAGRNPKWAWSGSSGGTDKKRWSGPSHQNRYSGQGGGQKNWGWQKPPHGRSERTAGGHSGSAGNPGHFSRVKEERAPSPDHKRRKLD